MKLFNYLLVVLLLGPALLLPLGSVVFGSERLDFALKGLQSTSIQERRNAAYDLGEFRSDRAALALIECLTDKDAHLRRIAARALGKIRNPKAVMPLVEILCQNSQPSQVQLTAVWALGNIGDPRAKRTLEHMAAHETGLLRKKAAENLARLRLTSQVGKWVPGK